MAVRKKQVDTENAHVVKRGGYIETLKAILAAGFCPFCEKHLFKHHRRPVLFKNRSWIVTENNWPYEGTKAHLLFIARKHIERTEDLTPAMWSDLRNAYLKTVKTLELKGATLMLRSGDMKRTGASVNHLHAHLIAGRPRTKSSKPISALVAFKK